MADVKRVYLLGGLPGWSETIGRELSVAVASEGGRHARDGDIVFLDGTGAGVDGLPFGNAFSACRELKRNPRVMVFVVLRDGDSFGPEIARFCMADGVLALGVDGDLAGFEQVLERVAPRRERPAIDALLQRLEERLEPSRTDSALQRILTHADDENVVRKLTDPETGLFDGPFAGFKLDEELKRASRFHQPLSLVLLACDVGAWPTDAGERSIVLAEIASIFLNECRDIDVLARFTESVFLFLLPGTGADGALIAARRIVDAVRERPLSSGLAVRAFAGVATVPHPRVRDRREFLALAEAALEIARTTVDGVGGPIG